MEKKLAGNTEESIKDKFFNNYSVDDYFDNIMANKTVRETLKKI